MRCLRKRYGHRQRGDYSARPVTAPRRPWPCACAASPCAPRRRPWQAGRRSRRPGGRSRGRPSRGHVPFRLGGGDLGRALGAVLAMVLLLGESGGRRRGGRRRLGGAGGEGVVDEVAVFSDVEAVLVEPGVGGRRGRLARSGGASGQGRGGDRDDGCGLGLGEPGDGGAEMGAPADHRHHGEDAEGSEGSGGGEAAPPPARGLRERGLEGEAHLGRRLEALARVPGQRLHHEGVGGLGDVERGGAVAGALGRALDLGVEDGDGARPRERQPAGEHLVEHAAQRVEVGARVDVGRRRLLRRHVLGRAEEGEAGLAAAGGGGAVGILGAARQAEVEELHHGGLCPPREEEVGGLDVPVHQRGAVGHLERRQDSPGETESLAMSQVVLRAPNAPPGSRLRGAP